MRNVQKYDLNVYVFGRLQRLFWCKAKAENHYPMCPDLLAPGCQHHSRAKAIQHQVKSSGRKCQADLAVTTRHLPLLPQFQTTLKVFNFKDLDSTLTNLYKNHLACLENSKCSINCLAYYLPLGKLILSCNLKKPKNLCTIY